MSGVVFEGTPFPTFVRAVAHLRNRNRLVIHAVDSTRTEA